MTVEWYREVEIQKKGGAHGMFKQYQYVRKLLMIIKSVSVDRNSS